MHHHGLLSRLCQPDPQARRFSAPQEPRSTRAFFSARPCRACSVHVLEPGSPGARITSPGFRGCRGGAAEGRLGDSQRLVPSPLPSAGCGFPHRKMRTNERPGAGPKPSRPPFGLIESYIKKFSSERGEGEGEGARGEGNEGEHVRLEGAP